MRSLCLVTGGSSDGEVDDGVTAPCGVGIFAEDGNPHPSFKYICSRSLSYS